MSSLIRKNLPCHWSGIEVGGSCLNESGSVASHDGVKEATVVIHMDYRYLRAKELVWIIETAKTALKEETRPKQDMVNQGEFVIIEGKREKPELLIQSVNTGQSIDISIQAALLSFMAAKAIVEYTERVYWRLKEESEHNRYMKVRTSVRTRFVDKVEVSLVEMREVIVEQIRTIERRVVDSFQFKFK
jgi:hypothetical protein